MRHTQCTLHSCPTDLFALLLCLIGGGAGVVGSGGGGTGVCM